MKIYGTRKSHFHSLQRDKFPIYSLCSAAVLIVVLSTASFAGENEWYVGAAVGSASVDPDVEETGLKNIDNQDTGFKLMIGKELSDQLSVEAFAANLGEAELINGSKVGYETYGASVSLTLPNNNAPVSAYAKGGLAYTDIDSAVPIKNDTTVGSFGGIGGEIKAGRNIAIRGEYEFYSVDTQLLSVGVVKRFGGSSDEVILMTPRLPRSQPTQPKTTVKMEPVVKPIPNKSQQISGDRAKQATLEGDLDRDGIIDSKDICKNTPAGVDVSKIGCANFIGVINGVTFDRNSNYLDAGTKSTLDIVASNLSKFKGQLFVIVGHTDSSEGTNKKRLSLKRALIASRHLVSKGIPASQLKFAGAGASKPIYSNSSDEGKAKNRRIEIYRAGS